MSKSKEERIKKLKKHHIWPSVLGLFLILFIFAVIMLVVVSVSVENLLDKKLTDSIRTSEKIAESFENYDSESEKTIEQTVWSYMNIIDEIQAVSVIDKDKNQIWSSSGEYPSMAEAVIVKDLLGLTHEEISIIIDDSENLLLINDGVIYIDTSNLGDYFNPESLEDDSIPAMQVKLWLVVPANDMQVMVLHDVSVYFTDFVFMITFVLLFGIMIAIFVIYYLISIITYYLCK